MDGLSAVTSVIAVVDISIKITTICSQYYKAVASAQDDVQRLETQVRGLQITLNLAREVIESSRNEHLSASRDFSSQLHGCWATLQNLLSKLEPNKKSSAMRKFGLRALKWPFNRKEMEATMSVLEQYQRRMTDSLQIDQTNILINIQTKLEKVSIQHEMDIPVAQKPHFIVPFPRDPDFISRSDIQSWIREQYAGTASRMAIIGIGGIGKSQLAIDFAYEIHDLYPQRSIFWVYGLTKDTIEESYRSFAFQLQMPGHDDPKANILVLVRDWLQREDVAPWLLILDNADDMNTFYQKEAPLPIASYLPKANHGKTLITSRNMTVAERLTGSFKAIKQIAKMHDGEAQLLLENKLSSGFDVAVAHKLLQGLDYIPLAITQAAAYINRRKMSMQRYLERFEASEKQRTGLLSYDGGDIWRHEAVSNSIVISWQVTFEQILHEKPSAANLLSFMSCFQPQGISSSMLFGYTDDPEDYEEEDEGYGAGDESDESSDDGDNGDEESAMEDDLDMLSGYSLVHESDAVSGLYEMHPLVQLCTRVWLSKSKKLSYWDTLFLRLTAEYFPSGSYETWDVCHMFLPHIVQILEKKPVTRSDLLSWAKLLAKTAWYTAEMGDYDEAEILIQRAIDTRKELLGVDNLNTLRSMAMLGVVHHEKGRYEDARKLQLQIVESNERTLEENDPFRIASISNLALTYYEQDRWEEAAMLQTQILESCRSQYGGDDNMTLTAMSNLALTYSKQGRHAEAERLERRVLEAQTEMLGDEHPSTLCSMNNLAMTLMKKEQWEDAEKLQQQVLKSRTELVGDTHPDTLVNMSNLAAILSKQGRLSEVEVLERHVVEARTELLGNDHPDTIKSMADLACTIEEQGRFEESDELQSQVLHILRKKLGDDHHKTLTRMAIVSYGLHRNNRVDEAIRLMEECCTRRERVLGMDHEDTESCRSILEMWKQNEQS